MPAYPECRPWIGVLRHVGTAAGRASRAPNTLRSLPEELPHLCVCSVPATKPCSVVVQNGPVVGRMEPMIRVELERVEALELLGMTLAHLNVAEARLEMSPRIPLLMAIRDKLAIALQEEA